MKRPGRPPLAENDRSVPVSFSLPSKQFDDLCSQARRDRVSVPELIRQKIRQADGRADEYSMKK